MGGRPAYRLGDATWTDLAGARPVLAVPVGSCEQHGPHLPLDTDTRIAVALADRLAAARAGVVVAPAIAVSASGEHAGFPGTLSIGTEALATALVELVRSADWSAGVVFVNGHGGNADAVGVAASTALTEGRRVLAWWPRIPGFDAHAGRAETSMVLALDPDAVRVERAEAGRREPIAELVDELRAHGVRAVSPNGVLGDPAGASAAEGAALLDQLTGDLVRAVERWTP
jgi:creatinine amidohydrolase